MTEQIPVITQAVVVLTVLWALIVFTLALLSRKGD